MARSLSRRASGDRRRLRRSFFEALEDRSLMATVNWTGAIDGSWANPGNWQGGVLPVSGTDDVLFSNANLLGASVTATSQDIPGFTVTGIAFNGATGFGINITAPNLTVAGDITDNTAANDTFSGNTLAFSAGADRRVFGTGQQSFSGPVTAAAKFGRITNGGTSIFTNTLSGTSFYVSGGGVTFDSGAAVTMTGEVAVGASTASYFNGGNAGTTPTLTIQGTATVSTATLNMGQNNGGPAQTNVLNQTGGTVTVTGNSGENAGIRIGHWPNSNNSYNLSGGSLNLTDATADVAIATDGTGTFNQTGGTLTAPGVWVDHRNAGGTASLSMTGGTATIGARGINVADSTGGSGAVIGGTAIVTTSSITISNYAASTLAVSGSNTLGVSGAINVGIAGIDGTLNVSGKTTTAANLNVVRGTAAINSAAVVNVTNNVGVGQAGAGGTLNVGGTAQLTVTNELNVGDAANIAGTVGQTGGTVQINNRIRLAHWPNNVSNYNLSAGTLGVTNALNVGWDGVGVFTQSGGAVTAGQVVVDGNGLTAAVSGQNDALNRSGGSLVTTALTIQGGDAVINGTATTTVNGNTTMSQLSDSTLTVGGSAGFTSTGYIAVGTAAAAGGTVTLTTSTPVAIAGLRVGRGTATINGATVNVSGGTVVGTNRSDEVPGMTAGSAANATLDVQAGALNTTGIVMGNTNGGGTVVGTLNQSGGTVTTTADAGEGNGIRLGHWPTGTGNYNLSAGTLNVNGTFALSAATDGTGVFTQTGGTANATQIDVNSRNGAGGNGTFTLNGGTFNVGSGGIVTDGGGGPFTVNLGGGTLRATANWNSSLNMNLTNAVGPALFDTNGFNIGLSGVLSGAGALTKVNSAGTLTLSAKNTYLGGTTVNGGTLMLSADGGDGVGTIRGTLNVNAGATVDNSVNNTFGYTAGTSVNVLNIVGGTVGGANFGQHFWNNFQLNMTGGTLNLGGTLNEFHNPTITVNSAATTAQILSVTGTAQLRLRDGTSATVAVADGAQAVDLLIAATVTQNSGTSGITKTGAGTMTLSGSGASANTAAGLLQIDGGTVIAGAGFAGDGGWSGNVTINNTATLQLAQSNIFNNGSDFTINTGGVLNMNALSDVIGNIQGGGNISGLSGSLVLDDLNATHTFSGNIAGGGGLQIRGNIANSGTLALTGATVAIGNLPIAKGTVTINGPVVTVSGLTTVGTNRTEEIGGNTNVASVAVLNIQNGSLTTVGIVAGNVAANTVVGTINQFGGTVTTTGDAAEGNGIRLGHWPNGTGNYNLSAGTLNVNGGFAVSAATDGAGSFVQTGGTANATQIDVNSRVAAGGNGTFTLNAGVFNLGAGGLVTDGGGGPYTVNLGGGTLRATANWNSILNANLTNATGPAIIDTNGFNVALSGVLSGAGGLTKANTAGTLTLSGANTFLGNVVVDGGTLSVGDVANNGAASHLGAGTTVNIANAGLLQFTGGAADATNRTINLSGSSGANSPRIEVTNAAGDLQLIGGAIAGAGQRLGKLGPGTLSLGTGTTATVANLYAAGGNLRLQNNAAVTASFVAVGANDFFILGGGGGTLTVQDTATLTAGTMSFGENNGGAAQTNTLNQSGGTVTVTGNSGENAAIRLGHWPNEASTYNLSGGTLNVNDLTSDIAIATDGTGTFNQTGGTANVPGITVNHRNAGGNATLTVQGGLMNIGARGITTAGGPAAVNFGGLGGTVRATANWSSSLPIALNGSGANAITIDTNGFAIGLSGVVSGGGDLIKTGGGVLTLSNTETYSGITTINGGTLSITGSLANGAANPDVIVNSGGTLGGTGTVNGSILVNSGGTVAPGLSPAILNSGSVTWTAGSFFDVEVNGLTVGTQYDQLNVTGTVALGGATLNLTGVHVPNPAALESFVIINNDLTDAVTGQFAGLAEGAQLALGGGFVYITYQGGDGNDVVLNSQPIVNGTAGADTVTLTPTSATTYTFQFNAHPAVNVTGAAPFTFNGLGGDDYLQVNVNAFATPTITYDGGAQDFTSRLPNSLGDLLGVIGTGAEVATYTPSVSTPGAGVVNSNGLINFTGLEPVDFASLASFTLTLPGANDVLTVASGTDAATGTLPAVVITGSSNAVAIESAHLRNIGTTTINTTATDGDDAITFNAADGSALAANLNNLIVNTGVGATDIVNVNGAVTVLGDVTVSSRTIAFGGGSLTAGAANVVTLTASNAITDAGAGTDVTADDLSASAVNGISLDTNIADLTATNTTAGGVDVDDVSALNVINVTAAGQSVILTAGGAITAGGVTEVTANSLAATASGGITLETNIVDLTASNTVSGAIVISETDALTVTAGGVSNTGGAVTLTTADNGADDLVLNGVVAASGAVTLNGGDNVTVNASLTAGTTLTINVDAGDNDAAGGVLSIVLPATVTAAGGAFFNGNADNDTFNFAPQSGAAITLDGLAPTTAPGDVLNIDINALTNPLLTLQGPGAGTWTFDAPLQPVVYTSIELVVPDDAYHLRLLASGTTFANTGVADNLTIRRDAVTPTDLVIERTGVLNAPNDFVDVIFQGPLATILSFTYVGSNDDDTVTIDDVNGLVNFNGTVPLSTGVGNNTNVADTPELFLDGGTGADGVVFALTATNTDQAYGFGAGAAPGVQEGEVRTSVGATVLSTYFRNMDGVQSNDATPADVGTLTLVGDAAANTIALASSAGGTTVSATGYVPFTFAPQAFNAAIVNAGDNNDALTLSSLNAAESGLALTLNGEAGADTITVETAPASNTLTLQGGADNDAYNLGGGLNTVDGIFSVMSVNDSAGSADSLTLVDSADLSGDTVTINDTTIDGVNGAPSANVTFGGIEALDVTTSGGGDTITTTLNGLGNLVTVNVRGAGGDDDFFLATADGMATLTTINLIGDAGSDDFGSAMTPIRPLAGPATNVWIYGDTTAITTNPGGAITDRLFLDMTTTSAGMPTLPLVIVDTVTGQATTANTRLLRFGGIDDIDLYDGGVLTDVAIGNLYLRATDGVDNLVFYRENGGVFVKRNGVPVSATPYAPTNRIVSYGRAGNDYMEFNFTLGSTLSADFRGENDNDTLVGGLGSDLLVGGGSNDVLRGGEGNDVLYGEDQFLTTSPISFADQRRTGLVQPLTLVGGNDTLEGGGGNDFLFGGTGADNLTGGLGNDYVHGGEGNDTLNSGGGNDILRGMEGADLINGAEGNDILLGGAGDDRIFGRGNRDFLLAGAGADQIQDDEASNDVVVAGGLVQDADDQFTLPTQLSGLNDYDLALQALMFTGPNAWSGAAPFATRVGNLTPLTAIINDTVADIILGNVGGQDYIISNANDMRLNTTGDQLLTV